MNLSDWGRHIIASLRDQAARSPDHRLDTFIEELVRYVPYDVAGHGHLGFAVPLVLRCDDDELHLITTLSTFATTVDITIEAELHLEAFLPADQATADHLRDRGNHQKRPLRPMSPQPGDGLEPRLMSKQDGTITDRVCPDAGSPRHRISRRGLAHELRLSGVRGSREAWRRPGRDTAGPARAPNLEDVFQWRTVREVTSHVCQPT